MNKKQTIKKTEYIIFRESLVQSLLADISTFGVLTFSFWFNKEFIGSSLLNGVILLVVIMMTLGRTSTKKIMFSDKKKLKEYVDSL